jgi:hypothetical protein
MQIAKLVAVSCLPLLVVSSLSSSAHGSTCERLNNTLNLCDVVPAAHGCPGAPAGAPTFREIMEWRKWLYSDPPPPEAQTVEAAEPFYQVACEKFYAKTKEPFYVNYDGPIEAVVLVDELGFPDGAGCHTDEDEDGEIDFVAHSSVYLMNVTRDSCCDRTPAGPYGPGGMFYVAGGGNTAGAPFSTLNKKKMRTENENAHSGVLWTDVGAALPGRFSQRFGAPAGSGLDYYKVLLHRDWLFALDDDSEEGKLLGPYEPNAAEVDHIIPRIDSNGCGCGTNSNANAAIISRKLNAEMSNSCQDPSRISIMERYSSAP